MPSSAAAAGRAGFPTNPAETTADGGFNFGRVVKLLTSKHSADDIDRHTHALTRLAKVHEKTGYRAADISDLATIAEIVLQKACRGLNPTYAQNFAAIVAPIALPLRDVRVSTRATDDANVCRLLNVVAKALDDEDGATQDTAQREKHVVSTVLQFARADPHNLDKLASSQIPVCLAAACGRVAKRLAAETSDSINFAEEAAPLNTLTFVLSEITRHPGCAAAVLESPTALPDLICCIGATPSSRARLGGRAPVALYTDEDFIGSVIEIMWNTLEAGHDTASRAKAQLSSRPSPAVDEGGSGGGGDGPAEEKPAPPPPALCAFADCFHRLCIGSHATAAARQLRNDTATVLMLLIDGSTAEAVAAAQCPVGSLLSTVARAFTTAEMPSKHPDCKKMRLSTVSEDFEFHKILQSCLERATAVGGGCRAAVAQGNVLGLFLEYARRRDGRKMREWTEPQLEELELLATHGLGVVGSALPELFLRLRGCTVLLELIGWSTEVTAPTVDAGGRRLFRGAGNGPLSTGDFSATDRSQAVGTAANNGRRAYLLQALRCMRRLVHHDSHGQDLVRELVDQGAMAQLLELLDSLLDQNDKFALWIQEEVLHTLAQICRASEHNQELLGEAGIRTLIAYSQHDVAKFERNIGYREVVVAAVDALWAGVVSCHLNEGMFLEFGGLFALLDLLDVEPPSMHNAVLGCISDLCGYADTRKQLIHWRSPRPGAASYTTAHLLIRLWEDEERRLGIEGAGEAFVIKEDDEFPLLPGGAPGVTGTVDEVTETIRSKVYALLACIEFAKLPGLSGRELAVMEKIKFYLTLKAGEVWAEVKNALDEAGVEPTATDVELLDNGISANREHVANLREGQKALLSTELEQQTKDLSNTFDDIAFRHYAEEQAATRLAETVVRTSEHDKLLDARQRQRDQIATSRLKCEPVTDAGAAHHESEGRPESYNGTVFPSQLLLSGLLQPGADGSAADDTIRLETALGSEIEAV